MDAPANENCTPGKQRNDCTKACPIIKTDTTIIVCGCNEQTKRYNTTVVVVVVVTRRRERERELGQSETENTIIITATGAACLLLPIVQQ